MNDSEYIFCICLFSIYKKKKEKKNNYLESNKKKKKNPNKQNNMQHLVYLKSSIRTEWVTLLTVPKQTNKTSN